MATPPTGPAHPPEPHPNDGAKLRDIVRYVMKHTKYTEDRATNAVIEVLNVGLATKKIFKTSRKTYILLDSKPVNLNYKIVEPHFSDDSSGDSTES